MTARIYEPIFGAELVWRDCILSELLEGLRILVLEDEFLIAMDVEQLCRDHGARDVVIKGRLGEIPEDAETLSGFDAAIIDLMLGGVSTLDFAARLQAREVPFVFATGYADLREIAQHFPEVAVIGKPYSGDVLVAAVAAACGRSRG
jgi:DNA-binding response OmpR family regulator